MAIGGQVALTGIPSLLAIYNSAPWIFDAVMLCTFLGLLFRSLIQKANIGKGDAQSKKIGSVLGFFLGLAMTGYMEYRGWHLFTDGGPWVLGTIVILLAMMLWAVVDKYFEGKHRTTTIPIFFIAAMIILWAFSHTLPSFNLGLNALGQWRWLVYIVFWAGLIFILFWALTSLFGLKYTGLGISWPSRTKKTGEAGTETEEPSGPGLLRRIGSALDPRKLFRKGPETESTEPKEKGPSWWWPGNWFKRKQKPSEEAETTGKTTDDETNKTVTETQKASKDADKTSAQVAAIITASEEYFSAIDEVLADLATVEQDINQKNRETNAKYIQKLAELQKLLQASKEKTNNANINFSKADIVKSFLTYNTTCQRIISRYSRITKLIPAYIQTLQDIRADINNVQELNTKAELIKRQEEYKAEAESIKSMLDKTYAEFIDYLKQSTQIAQIQKLGNLTDNIKAQKISLIKALDDIISNIAALIALNIKKDKEETSIKQYSEGQPPQELINKIADSNNKIAAAKEKIRQQIVNAMGGCNSIKHSLEEFASNAKNILTAIKGMKSANDYAVNKVLVDIMNRFRGLRGKVRILDQELKNQFTRETPIPAAEPAKQIQTLEQIKNNILDQRQALKILYIAAKKATTAFSRYAVKQKVIKIDSDNARQQMLPVWRAVNIVIQPEMKLLRQSENALTSAFTQIRTAITALDDYKNQATTNEMTLINAVQKNLTKYLGYEKNIRALLNNFEMTLSQYLMSQANSGKTVAETITNINAIIQQQEKLLNLLDPSPIIQEMNRREMPTPSRRAGSQEAPRLRRRTMPPPSQRR